LTRPTGTLTHSSQLFTAIASAGFVLTGVVNTFLGPILPILSARWALSDSRAGYFFATQFLGSILGVIVSSFLLPRYGFRLIIGISYLLMAVGVNGLLLSEWRYALLGTLALGLGLGFVIPATNLFVSKTNPERRSSALSILNFCWGLGAVSAPVALYATASRNHSSVFLLVLSVLLLVLAATLAFSTETTPVHEDKSIDHSPKQTEWRFAAIVGGMFFLYVAVEASVGGWIATLAERLAAGTSTRWILAPSLFWGGLLAGRGLAPLLLMRLRERAVALAGLALAGAALCVLVFSSHWQWVTAAGLVAGAGLAAIFPITVALLSRFQDMETKNAGLMFAMAGLGGAIMPWLVGAVSTRSESLQIGLMVPLLATVVLLWLHAIGNQGSQPVSE
jgi:FHS family glucose/mannose:H+ symporter-like MFS transporter